MRFGAAASWRRLLLLLDTALVSLNGALVIIVATRVLDGDREINALAVLIFFAALGVGLQRATFLNPALATRSYTGVEYVIPLNWICRASLPMSASMVVCTVSYWFSQGLWSTIGLAHVIAAICAPILQDGLRFILLSMNATLVTVFGDLAWFLTTGTALALVRPQDPAAFLLCWASGAAVSASMMLLLFPKSRTKNENASMRATLRLGKYSGSDALLSGIAGLLPILVTTSGAAPLLVAVYRILQTAMGPLNTLSSTALTVAGLESGRYADKNEINMLAQRNRRFSLIGAIVSAGSMAFMAPALLLVSGLDPRVYLFPVAVAIIAAGMGAATIPYSVTSAALGGQKYGLAVRAAVVLLSSSISIVWLTAEPAYGDAIGSVTLVASTTAFMGWRWASRRVQAARTQMASPVATMHHPAT